MTRDLAPEDSVALFDSATALQGALAAALHGRPFPQLGNSAGAGRAARLGGTLPWPLLSRIYVRIGAAEGIPPERLGNVDLAAVARWLTEAYPEHRYPAVMIGSSNGALTQLAAAVGLPWLPGTVLVPVKRTGDPDRPVDALRFGERWAPSLLRRNPDIALHHMHDQVQDQLMVAKMTYFRVKWQSLPAAYEQFMINSLLPDAPVILVEDQSEWPVVRVGGRHVFQPGAQGGLSPADYLERPDTPATDDHAREAEWGGDPLLGRSVEQWCAATGRPLIKIIYTGPQAPSAAVATTMRTWTAARGERSDQLMVPTFVIGDPWLTINTGHVPFWGFFSVKPALDSLRDYLASTDPYAVVRLLLFQHGVQSAGIATPDDWAAVVRAAGAEPDFLGLDLHRFPHDIGFLGRYGDRLDALPRARHLWEALPLATALAGLQTAGLISGDDARDGESS